MNSFVEHIPKLQKLLACDDIQILTKQGGGNSVVFCIQAENKKWAVKSYPPFAPNQRDRLAAELSVYQFLNAHQVPAVPTLKTYCPDERWLIMDWVEGSIPKTYSDFDIDQAIQFIRSIAALNVLPQAKNLPQAAEACVSLEVLLQQIKARLKRLETAAEQEPDLYQFLNDRFVPAFNQYENQIKKYYLSKNMKVDEPLPQSFCSLIPADFGFHNTLRDASGRLYFFDFDYFGWDDPVKLLADILWHPKMNLSEAQKAQFIRGISEIYSEDVSFLSRFNFTHPLFGLRWVLILLNEFIPAIWLNRQHAEVYSQDQTEVKKTQLKRAKDFLVNVEEVFSVKEGKP